MDDVAFYTTYYSPYYARAAAEAEAAAATPRKRQFIVCALLAFGAACGISTVAVGFYAHNPAITWPVVAVGLIGVVAGVTLAHMQLTAASAAVFLTPIYVADTADLELRGCAPCAACGGWRTARDERLADPLLPPLKGGDAAGAEAALQGHAAAAQCPGGNAVISRPTADTAAFSISAGGDAAAAPGTPCASCGGREGSTASKTETPGGASGAAGPAAGPAAAAATAAAAVVGCGAVACGLPAGGAVVVDGWVDTRPVLVLQPHPLWARYFGHLPVAPELQPQPQRGPDDASAPSPTPAPAALWEAGLAEDIEPQPEPALELSMPVPSPPPRAVPPSPPPGHSAALQPTHRLGEGECRVAAQPRAAAADVELTAAAEPSAERAL
ncbi:hypothetical protein GPECTOR_11g299 [Gonium pectorale]|uniref:Uncharacterized protein n=1 Tax=Gonium pectorale TaxID=33097 RepID=A0A150GPX4_GONPE|nr:hypothetical protein GPECTOR_11g299 [Gonium pectorale]|eukprot:KXZ51861.1 hypothetical protein GPECTOR_11g299 [Gonium pectorale]